MSQSERILLRRTAPPTASRAEQGPWVPAAFSAFSAVSAFSALAAVSVLVLLGGCKASPVLKAERSAPVGNEFIRLFPDGHAEYGYVVVKENLKAQGRYRYANDTVWFPDEAFKAHFPAGYLPIKEGVLYMESGLHFKITSNGLK